MMDLLTCVFCGTSATQIIVVVMCFQSMFNRPLVSSSYDYFFSFGLYISCHIVLKAKWEKVNDYINGQQLMKLKTH